MTLNQLKNLRLNGHHPKNIVFISLVGKLDTSNLVIQISRNDSDFRPLVGLDIYIYTNNSGAKYAIELADKIFRVNPAWLAVSNIDSKRTAICVMDYEKIICPGTYHEVDRI